MLIVINEFELFTDGACQPNPGKGGWAFVLRGTRDGELIEIERTGSEPNTTNNRMELEAVRQGFRCFLEKMQSHKDSLTLVSDSKYLIQGIEIWCEGWIKRGWRKADNKPVLNQDLWEDIYNLKKNIQLVCRHVRGHAGHDMNERVDRLAVKAAQNI